MNLRDNGTLEGFAWRWLALALIGLAMVLFAGALAGCDPDPVPPALPDAAECPAEGCPPSAPPLIDAGLCTRFGCDLPD